MLNIAKDIAKNIEKGVKPLIGWEKGTEIVKIGADGTPTKRIDLIAENIAINSLEKKCSAILISEEIGYKQIGNNPKYIIVLDPIDGTYNALNDIPVYSVSVALGKLNNELLGNGIEDSIKNIKNINSNNNSNSSNNSNSNNNSNNSNNNYYEKILNKLTIDNLSVGVVRNIATGEVYCAEKGKGSFVIKNNIKKKISPSNISNLSEASVGVFAYGLTTNTLDFIKDRKVRRIRILGSAALELCFVARGSLDGFINVNNTTRLCDIAGGYVILKEAGGKITNRDGKPINMPLNINAKSSIICSNEILNKKFVGIFGNKWKLKPTKFLIVSRTDREDAINLSKKIINYLEKNNVNYSLDEELFKILENNINNKYKNKNNKEILFNNIKNISHIISIGGDGTVLKCIRLADNNEIPIISINKGTVGFLAEFSEENVFNIIDKVIKGNYEIEKRTKLGGYINKIINNNTNQIKIHDALNEIVLASKYPSKMVQFKVYINGNFVEDIRADGLIVSTPTGSTAYSLSAGGPIVEHNINGFIIVPICPFKLSSRPLVVKGSSEIKIKIVRKEALLSIDGIIEGELNCNDEIILRKSDSYGYFVKGVGFYENLRKLSILDSVNNK